MKANKLEEFVSKLFQKKKKISFVKDGENIYYTTSEKNGREKIITEVHEEFYYEHETPKRMSVVNYKLYYPNPNKLATNSFSDDWREYLVEQGHDFTYGMSMAYNDKTTEMLREWNPKDSKLK